MYPHFDRLAGMEREYRRAAFHSGNPAVGVSPDVSAPLSRDQLSVADGLGTASPHSYESPWYVFVPRLTRLSATVAQQRLRRDYARVDLNTLKRQARVWGVEPE